MSQTLGVFFSIKFQVVKLLQWYTPENEWMSPEKWTILAGNTSELTIDFQWKAVSFQGSNHFIHIFHLPTSTSPLFFYYGNFGWSHLPTNPKIPSATKPVAVATSIAKLCLSDSAVAESWILSWEQPRGREPVVPTVPPGSPLRESPPFSWWRRVSW